MARRELLNDDERHRLFGVPENHDGLVKLYTLSPSDGTLITARRGASNRLGFAVQMALLNHPGIPLGTFGEVPGNLVAFMAKQLGVPAGKFAGYAERVQTATDHALELMTVLGLRPSAEDDLNLMIEAGARAAWSTEGGFEIATAIVAALCSAGILLPTRSRIERTGIAGRARARKQSYEMLLGGVPGKSKTLMRP